MNRKILAIALVLLMLLGLVACSKDEGDPNEIVIGDYTAYYTGSKILTDYDGDEAIAMYFDFTNNSKEDASFIWTMFYTVTQNGTEMEQATVFLSEDSFETLFDTTMEDVAPGATLEVVLTYKIKDKTAPVEIEFSDLLGKHKDKLTIDPSTVPAGEVSAPAEEEPEEPAEEPEEPADAVILPADGDNAVYKATAMIAEGTEMGADILEMMGDFYAVLRGDGTAVLDMFDSVLEMEYDGTEFTLSGVSFAPYTLDGDTMTIDLEGTEFILTLTDEPYEIPDATEIPDDAVEKVGYAFDTDIATNYAGDWHGMAEFYDCTGDYSDEDEMQCEIIARLVFDEEGYCTPYVRLCLESKDETENLVIDSFSYDEEYNCMLINGTLNGKPLDPIDSFIECLDGVLYIGAAYDDGSGDVFNVIGCLRRLDAEWDYENDYPYLPEDGVEFYMGKTFEEIVELYGYDTDLIPEMDGMPVVDDPAEPEEPEAPAVDAADGIVELQQLIDWKAWLDEVNCYETEYYTPTFEECIEAMGGIEPAPRDEDEWDNEYRFYKWTTADGKDHIIITLKPTDDGSGWRYHSISWSSGVNG